MAQALRHSAKPYHLKLFFSNRNTHAQVSVVRAVDGHIVAAASTVEAAQREALPTRSDKAAATVVGQLLAQRAQQASVDGVHWDRKRGQRYHGKIAALLTAMKAGGLQLV